MVATRCCSVGGGAGFTLRGRPRELFGDLGKEDVRGGRLLAAGWPGTWSVAMTDVRRRGQETQLERVLVSLSP